jgi:pentatricopeptide repeat protein
LIVDGAGSAVLQGPVGEDPVSIEVTVSCDPQEVALLGEALGGATDREGAAQTVLAAGEGASGTVAGGDDLLVDIRENGAGNLAATAGERGDAEICILGPVDVVGGDPEALEPSRRLAALGLLAYLATHPRPVSADEIGGALWPLDARRDSLEGPQRKTVMNVISRARTLVGYGLGGKERLVHSPMGYTLSPDVTCDWTRFEKYAASARRMAPPEAIGALRHALELVRGAPFCGAISSQFFEWVASEHLDMTLCAKAVDVAQDLGELALEAGDLATVTWAVEKGLQLEPTREEMFQLWMHALGRAGRPAKVDEVYRRMKLVLRQRIHPLQEPLEASRLVWRSYTSAEVGDLTG